MARINDSLLAGASGRVGRLVVANLFGNDILKARPSKRTKSPTTKQVLIQNRMVLCADFMTPYRHFACNHFGKRIGMQSCYNLAMTNLMSNFLIDYTTGTISPQYAGIYFAKGSLLGIIGATASFDTDGNLNISWQNNAPANTDRETDLLQILVAQDANAKTMFVENAAERLTTTYTAIMPTLATGDKIHLWLAFRATDESNVCNSFYVGMLTR